MSLTPKNWSSFQHYKDRSPAWIKLHRGLLDDFEFSRLPVASRALAPLLWLLASESDDGEISGSIEEIAFRVRMIETDLREAIKPLIESGFFIDDSSLLAECKHEAIPEREEEEQEKTEEKDTSLRSVATTKGVFPREKQTDDWPPDHRQQFWDAYPRKKAKKATFKILDRIRKSGEVTFERLMAGVRKIPLNEPVFIKHPSTWLNGGCWDDEELPEKPNGQDHAETGSLSSFARKVAGEADRIARGDSVRDEGSGGPIRIVSSG